jgi:hypothetical protein
MLQRDPLSHTCFPKNHAQLAYSQSYTESQEERSTFCEVTTSVILSKKVYMHMCPIPNGFRDRAISLYSTLYTPDMEGSCEYIE